MLTEKDKIIRDDLLIYAQCLAQGIQVQTATKARAFAALELHLSQFDVSLKELLNKDYQDALIQLTPILESLINIGQVDLRLSLLVILSGKRKKLNANKLTFSDPKVGYYEDILFEYSISNSRDISGLISILGNPKRPKLPLRNAA